MILMNSDNIMSLSHNVIYIIAKKEERRTGIMATIKPIQATPTLSGRDARELIIQTNTVPTEESIKRNELLCDVLKSIRKNELSKQ